MIFKAAWSWVAPWTLVFLCVTKDYGSKIWKYRSKNTLKMGSAYLKFWSSKFKYEVLFFLPDVILSETYVKPVVMNTRW